MMVSMSCSNLSSIAKFFLLSTACPGILGPARFRSGSPLPCGRADVSALHNGMHHPGPYSRAIEIQHCIARWCVVRPKHANKDFRKEISEHMRTQICGHPQKKEAVSGSCSEEDDGASGFAWLAREPKLMCGAEGRASSQRSIDYHIPPGPPQQ